MATPNNLTYTLSIVIPVYRSALILPKLVKQIHSEMCKEGLDKCFELLLVNDCSTDNSWDVIRSLAAEYSFIKGISLRRNFGQHNATMAGLNKASGEFVVIMDDDLQHPPQAIGGMVRALQSGCDVCYTRYKKRKHACWKKLGSQINDWIATRLLNKPKGLYLSSFKALRRDVVREIIKYDGPYVYVDGLILDVTRSITTIDIEHQSRDEGQSNYTIFRSLSLCMGMATSFSVLPLRMAAYTGMLLATMSLVMLIYVIVMKLAHPELPAGWASLVVTVLFIGGVQTLCMGIIGEYLGRTYLKLNRKPQFVVAATTENNDPQ